jgi:hypothetical protein
VAYDLHSACTLGQGVLALATAWTPHLPQKRLACSLIVLVLDPGWSNGQGLPVCSFGKKTRTSTSTITSSIAESG